MGNRECVDQGAYLVNIETESEQAWIETWLRDTHGQHIHYNTIHNIIQTFIYLIPIYESISTFPELYFGFGF